MLMKLKPLAKTICRVWFVSLRYSRKTPQKYWQPTEKNQNGRHFVSLVEVAFDILELYCGYNAMKRTKLDKWF